MYTEHGYQQTLIQSPKNQDGVNIIGSFLTNDRFKDIFQFLIMYQCKQYAMGSITWRLYQLIKGIRLAIFPWIHDCRTRIMIQLKCLEVVHHQRPLCKTYRFVSSKITLNSVELILNLTAWDESMTTQRLKKATLFTSIGNKVEKLKQSWKLKHVGQVGHTRLT